MTHTERTEYTQHAGTQSAERLAYPITAAGDGRIVGEAHRLERGLWIGNPAGWTHDGPFTIGYSREQVADGVRLAVYARSALAEETQP